MDGSLDLKTENLLKEIKQGVTNKLRKNHSRQVDVAVSKVESDAHEWDGYVLIAIIVRVLHNVSGNPTKGKLSFSQYISNDFFNVDNAGTIAGDIYNKISEHM